MRYAKISERSAIVSAAFVIIVCIAALFAPLRAAAEGTAQFYIPDSAVPAASQFNVSVEFTADANIGTVQAQISYDENAIEFISSDFGNGGGGLVTLGAFPDSPSSTLMVSMTFRALNPGSTRLDLIGATVLSPDGAMLANSMTAYASVAVSEAQTADSSPDSSLADESDDSEVVQTPSLPDGRDDSSAQLKSLTVSEGQLQPAFSPDVYDYTMTLPHDVDYLYIDAETADPLAGIWFEGSEYLADGMTPRTITVTSPDGSIVNVYRISVTRLGDGETEESYSDEDEYVIPGNEAYSDGSSDSAGDNSKVRKHISSKEEKSGVQEMRDRLMPALIVAMVVIVLAIIIMIYWIRSKSGKHK